LDFHQAGVLLSASLIFRHGGWIDRPSGECRLMMLEKNRDAVAARIETWVDKALPERVARR
jgi:hypothetical protein